MQYLIQNANLHPFTMSVWLQSAEETMRAAKEPTLRILEFDVPRVVERAVIVKAPSWDSITDRAS